MVKSFIKIIDGIKQIHASEEVPLYRFTKWGNEVDYFQRVLEENNVTTSGKMVIEAEEKIKQLTGAKFAIATTSGTSALHVSLHALECNQNCEVITQAFTFVATVNAILYTGAKPILLDNDRDCLGLSPQALRNFLNDKCEVRAEGTFNKRTGKRIHSCVPVHILGDSAKITELYRICKEYNIHLIEDAAQAFGSKYNGRALGSFGELGVFSFNGSKVVSAGMGGAIITNNEAYAKNIKHLVATAKKIEGTSIVHDQMGFNYRMSNLNASLLLSQLDHFDEILASKRALNTKYIELLQHIGVDHLNPIDGCESNFWMNNLIIDSTIECSKFIQLANDNKVDCRRSWVLLNDLNFCQSFETDELLHARHFNDRLVLLPSGL